MKLKSNLIKISLSSLILLTACGLRNANQTAGKTFDAKTNFPPLINSDTKINSDSKIVATNNKFGINLFAELLKTNKDKNIFISPTSVLFALSMTYNGANGKTKDDIAKALELTGMTSDEINKGNNALIRTLINSDPNVRLDIANSLWGKKGINFNPDFIKTNEDYYKATTNSLDFSTDDATKTINQWVSDATQQKIPKIVDKIDADTLLILINAIYFKGAWTNKFDNSLTKSDTFNLTSSTTKQAQMMSMYDKLSYYKDDKFQAINLPYGNENISMYVFLPSEDSSLDEFNKSLTSDNMQTWFTSFRKSQGQIILPKFKLEYQTSLNSSLTALGMGNAFSDNADFKNMFKDNTKVAITDVKHKTFVEVNEEGTEAAAVTSVTVGATSVQIPTEPFKMNVNRPFFYMIRDNQSGTVLFMGEVVNPS